MVCVAGKGSHNRTVTQVLRQLEQGGPRMRICVPRLGCGCKAFHRCSAPMHQRLMNLYTYTMRSPPPSQSSSSGAHAHQVQRQPIVGEHDDKEDHVHKQMQQVGDQLQVEHVCALGLPPAGAWQGVSTSGLMRNLRAAPCVCGAQQVGAATGQSVLAGAAWRGHTARHSMCPPCKAAWSHLPSSHRSTMDMMYLTKKRTCTEQQCRACWPGLHATPAGLTARAGLTGWATSSPKTQQPHHI